MRPLWLIITMEKEILKTRRANITHKTECVWDTTYQIVVTNGVEDRLRTKVIYPHPQKRPQVDTNLQVRRQWYEKSRNLYSIRGLYPECHGKQFYIRNTNKHIVIYLDILFFSRNTKLEFTCCKLCNANSSICFYVFLPTKSLLIMFMALQSIWFIAIVAWTTNNAILRFTFAIINPTW